MKKRTIRREKKVYSKSDRAITLIALIVTIIVLLVLAGVTIANVMGNQGVIKKAKIAANNYDTQSAKDRKSTRLNSSHRSLSRMPSSA